MANAERCCCCGYQETEHVYPELVDLPKERLPGYRTAFIKCTGFKAKKLSKKERLDMERRENCEFEAMERGARSREAWGIYGAFTRDRNFLERLHELGGEERERFLAAANSENGHGFYIG